MGKAESKRPRHVDNRSGKGPSPRQRIPWAISMLFAGVLVSLAADAAGDSYEQQMKQGSSWQQGFTKDNESIIHYGGASSIRHSERSYGEAEERVNRESQERDASLEAASRQASEAQARSAGSAEDRRAGDASYRGSIRHDSR